MSFPKQVSSFFRSCTYVLSRTLAWKKMWFTTSLLCWKKKTMLQIKKRKWKMCIRSQWLSNDGPSNHSSLFTDWLLSRHESPWTCISTSMTTNSLSAEHLMHQSFFFIYFFWGRKYPFPWLSFSVLCIAGHIKVCGEKWTPTDATRWEFDHGAWKLSLREKERECEGNVGLCLVTAKPARPCSRFCCPGQEAAL